MKKIFLNILVLFICSGNYAQLNPGIALTGYANGLGIDTLLGRNFLAPFTLAQTNCSSVTCLQILPVHLLEFTGKTENGINTVFWKTTDEINSSHFEIERSADGSQFKKTGMVTALNMPGIHNYNFDDLHPLSGNNYYRLKIIDIDSHFEYSKIILLVIDNTSTCKIYPNPANDKLNFVWYSGSNSLLNQVIVYDAAGRVMMQRPVRTVSGNNTLLIGCASYTPGIYSLQWQDEKGNFSKVLKFVIIH